MTALFHSRRSNAALLFFSAIFILGASAVHAYSKAINENTGAEYTDLQAAINDANSGDRLKLKGCFKGSFVINKSLALIGSHEAVLDGQQAGRVLDIGEVGDITVFIEHVTIKNGNANVGAGILNIATLILKHVKVEDNTATGLSPLGPRLKTSYQYGGAGIANFTFNFVNEVSGPGSLTIIDSEIKNNTSLNASVGGGILSLGYLVPCTVLIKDSKIQSNTSGAGLGGGLALIQSNNEIIDTDIENNTSLSSAGGGIANGAASTTTLTKVKVGYNTAGVGAGIDNASILTLNHSKIEWNNAVETGGGIQNEATGSTTLNDSKVSHNSAGTDGGGIYNVAGSGLTINGGEVDHNSPNNIAP